MALTLTEITRNVNGRLVGEGQTRITGAAILRDAAAGDITFLNDSRLLPLIDSCGASAALVDDGIEVNGLPYVVVPDSYSAFTRVVAHFQPARRLICAGVSPQAFVSPTAVIGEHVSVAPGVAIGDAVSIGPGSTIHCGVQIMAGSKLGAQVQVFPGAVLYEGTIVGARCIIHANVVLGCFGFGYESEGGEHRLCPQLGHVEIGEDVEIGAGTTIDRGTFGPTRIGDGTKIDNQVMVGHNCRIGKHNLLCSQVGIAGSVTTGDHVVMAGQVGIKDHVNIVDHVILGAQTGVASDITQPGTHFGTPSLPGKEQFQILASRKKLPTMRRQLKELLRTVEQLKSTDQRKPHSDAA